MKKSLLLLLIVLFIGVNLFLLEKGESKAARVTHLSNWEILVSGSLEKTLQTDGVVVPEEQYPVFIDQKMPFKQFLVEKGDVVEKGTPLFEYETSQQQEQITLLDAEISRLEAEKRNIDTYIEDLVQMKPTVYPANVYTNEEDEQSSQVADALNGNSIQAQTLSLDQAIAEKELDKAQIAEMIQQYQQQRDAIEMGIKGLTIISPAAGKIGELSLQLDNPLLTIYSERSFILGSLSEQQVEKVQPDMPVKLYSRETEKKTTGKVLDIDELPAEKATLKQSSLYPFTIHLETEQNDWRIGHHVETTIVLNEAHDIPVVAKKSIVKAHGQTFLWGLTEEGTIERKNIQSGLLVDKRQEIKSGLMAGDYYVTNPQEVRTNGPFITSFQWQRSILNKWQEASARKITKYILVGLLQR